MDSMVQEIIKQYIAESDSSSQLVDRAKIIDKLLDIRLMVEGNPELLIKLDRILAQVPGVTVVSLIWWRSALIDLENFIKSDSLVEL